MLDKKALLLVGSPKKKNGTSEALGSYLVESLDNTGYKTEKLHVLSAVKGDVQELLDKVHNTDLVIISFPLYVDSLPSHLIRALELIANNRKERKPNKEQELVAIINCGFPEALQNDTALKICKNFAVNNDFKWIGGLAMGAGPAINGRSLKSLGGMTRNIVKALDIATEAIANNEDIPSIATDLMSSKLFPTWLYTFVGNRGWITQAKKFNVHKELYARPDVKG